MPKRCIFCNGGHPFSQEHVLPEWIAQLLELGRVEVSRTIMDGPQDRWQKIGTFGHTIGDVCECCNTGWMSDLEDLSKPILSSMILPRERRRIELSPDEQVVLASWLWKIAILHESVSTEKYFNEDERQALRRGDSPPSENVLMWISKYVGPLIANLRGGPSTFSTPDGRKLDGVLVSMTIGLFAAQLLHARLT